MNHEPRYRRLHRFCDRALLGLLIGVLLVVLRGLIFLAEIKGSSIFAVPYILIAVSLGVVCAGIVWQRSTLYRFVSAPRLFTVLLSIGLAIFGLEVGANLLNPKGYLYFADAERYFSWQSYAPSVKVSHAHPPNGRLEFRWGTVTTNSLGWRCAEVTKDPDPGRLRILALGDSVVFGWGVDDHETLPRQIEEILQARLSELPQPYSSVEVINTGNGSFTCVDEYIVLRDRGISLGPQASFVLTIHNDFDYPALEDQVETLAQLGVEDEEFLASLSHSAKSRRIRAESYFLRELVSRSFLFTTIWRGLRPRQELNPHPYRDEQIAALLGIAQTCQRHQIRHLTFSYALKQDDRAAVDKALRSEGPVFHLPIPKQGGAAMVNSAVDPHWNRNGIRFYAEKIADALIQELSKERE